MTRGNAEYIGFLLARAREVLDEAEHLRNAGFTIGVVNRIYYACFYAVSALLMLEGQASAKHSGVMSMFDLLWIKPGRFPSEMGRFYHLIFEQRQRGDYQDLDSFEDADLALWLAQANSLIAAITAYVESHADLP